MESKGSVTPSMRPVQTFLSGFLQLFLGAREAVRVRGAWWLLTVPVLLNLGLFVLLAFGFWTWGVPLVSDLVMVGERSWWIAALVWIGIVAVFGLLLVGYAFVFSIVAEVIGAPFYEEIGVRLDKSAGAPIVERTIWQEVVFAVRQESVKLVLLGLVALFGFVLQFLPGVGQVLSAVFGFSVLVVTAGADAVGPALARRGLMLADRRKWVLAHLAPVLGLGAAKALGLVIPVFNIVVLPMAAAGGTRLVQHYDGS